MDAKSKERGILKEPRPRIVADARRELTPQGSCEHAPISPQPSVDRLSVTWADPDPSMSAAGASLFHLPSEVPVSSEVKFSPGAPAEGSDDEDYSASLSAVLRQRRASVRRSRKGRARRPSSPFLPDETRPRRRSSVFTTSSGDTAISMEECQSAVVTQEQIFENIHLHKEVLGSVKQQPLGMRRKLKIVHQAKGYIKRHEGQLQERLAQSKCTRDIYARFNILLTTRWQQLKREAANTSNLLIPWELRIKEIESHFGSVVASYFTFLRWLFWVNLVVGFILLVFVIVPEYLTAVPQQDGGRKIIMDDERGNASNLLMLWEFEGILKFSPIFYGYYSNVERPQYRMPLAYFLTGLAVYIYSFVAILRKMAENSRMSKLSEKEDECIFSWKLFTGWDFMIGNTETAHNRIASVILGFKEALLEEAEKKKDLGNWRSISRRAVVNICVMILLAVSAFAVVTVVSRSDNNAKPRSWWRENETTIVVTVISITFPVFFELLGLLEHYHPRKQLRLQLARIMLLNLINLYSLIFALFSKIEGMTHELGGLKPILNDSISTNPDMNVTWAFNYSESCTEERVSCEPCTFHPLIAATLTSPPYTDHNNNQSTVNKISNITAVKNAKDNPLVENLIEQAKNENKEYSAALVTLNNHDEESLVDTTIRATMTDYDDIGITTPNYDLTSTKNSEAKNFANYGLSTTEIKGEQEADITINDNDINITKDETTIMYSNENDTTTSDLELTITSNEIETTTYDTALLIHKELERLRSLSQATANDSIIDVDEDDEGGYYDNYDFDNYTENEIRSKFTTLPSVTSTVTDNIDLNLTDIGDMITHYDETTTSSTGMENTDTQYYETSTLSTNDVSTSVQYNEESTLSTNMVDTSIQYDEVRTMSTDMIDTSGQYDEVSSLPTESVDITSHYDKSSILSTDMIDLTIQYDETRTLSTDMDDASTQYAEASTLSTDMQMSISTKVAPEPASIGPSTNYPIATSDEVTKSKLDTLPNKSDTTYTDLLTTLIVTDQPYLNGNSTLVPTDLINATISNSPVTSYLENVTTTIAYTTTGPTCPDVFNCTKNCGGRNITHMFTLSNCKIVDQKCFVSKCVKHINNTMEKANVTSVDIAYKDDHNRKMYNLTTKTKKKLLKLCWETMFGQELVKLTMMDLVFVLLGTLFMDFFRALFVRYMNRCWCWDLEKQFPDYSDFKIAENILHLINNQGMVWMGMFFSPGLVVLNVVKLMIMMYLRSWAVMTCNVPHEVVFRVSKSNNFYLALLLTMLFLCVLPVGYTIVWVTPSWHCGPFSEYDKIYKILTNNIYKILPKSLNFALEYIASPAIVIPLLVLLILIIYYLTSLTNSLREANNDLKIQLRRERTEERRKMFQLADTRRRVGSSAMDNTPFARWKKALPSLPLSKSIDSDDRKTITADDTTEPLKAVKKKGSIFAKIVGMALDKKPDDIPEANNVSQSSNNVDDETDTDFHETLPKEVLKIKDIIFKHAEKKKSNVEFKTDNVRPKLTDLMGLKVKSEKEDDRTEKKANIEKQKQDRDKEITKSKKTGENVNRGSKKMDKKQTSETSTQSKQSDSTIGSVIPVITISTTESDEETLQSQKNKEHDKNVIKYKDDEKQETVTEAPEGLKRMKKSISDLKSLRRQSSVDSIKEQKSPKEKKPDDGHKYQYSL